MQALALMDMYRGAFTLHCRECEAKAGADGYLEGVVDGVLAATKDPSLFFPGIDRWIEFHRRTHPKHHPRLDRTTKPG